jgi:hypothetical protein
MRSARAPARRGVRSDGSGNTGIYVSGRRAKRYIQSIDRILIFTLAVNIGALPWSANAELRGG